MQGDPDSLRHWMSGRRCSIGESSSFVVRVYLFWYLMVDIRAGILFDRHTSVRR